MYIRKKKARSRNVFKLKIPLDFVVVAGASYTVRSIEIYLVSFAHFFLHSFHQWDPIDAGLCSHTLCKENIFKSRCEKTDRRMMKKKSFIFRYPLNKIHTILLICFFFPSMFFGLCRIMELIVKICSRC